MKTMWKLLALVCVCMMETTHVTAEEQRPIVIAHRGASGYLPEHTLPAKALAHAMGADYLEQDCVLTKDDVPIVMHDIHLDTVTNVAAIFPDRKRADGRYYAIDFTLAEIKRLNVNERINLKTGKAVYPQRFPVGKSTFSVPTLAEEIEFIQGLNQSTGLNVGIYPEIKSPAWHRDEGKDISRFVVDVVHRYGYKSKDDRCYLQCFDPAETRRLREELKTELRIIQLIGDNSWKEAKADYDALRTKDGLREIAEYADGIGPSMHHIITDDDKDGTAESTGLVANAHALGLQVHPYTFRSDAMPKYSNDFQAVLRRFLVDEKIDGLFSDFPDQAVAAVRELAK